MKIKALIVSIAAQAALLAILALPASAQTAEEYPYGSYEPHAIPASNYGSGFVPSPALVGGNVHPGVIYASNYGAGFVPSQNLYLGRRPGFRFGGYGSGFYPSPMPWYGYGSFLTFF